MRKFVITVMVLFSLNSYAVTQKIEVLGMVCAFCAQGLEKSFKSEENVKDVFVSLENYFVLIESKDGKELNESLIKTIITEAGYDINKIEIISDSVSSIRKNYESK